MSEKPIPAGMVAPGEYAPAGEAQGIGERFAAADVATAFGVDVERVHRAMAGELGLSGGQEISSRQAQELAEVLLGDRPLADREAALMQLGAFTPRPDEVSGIGEKPEDEESLPPMARNKIAL